MNNFPVLYNDKLIEGCVSLDDEMVRILEEGMKERFTNEDCETFIINATFVADIEKQTMKLREFMIYKTKETDHDSRT